MNQVSCSWCLEVKISLLVQYCLETVFNSCIILVNTRLSRTHRDATPGDGKTSRSIVIREATDLTRNNRIDLESLKSLHQVQRTKTFWAFGSNIIYCIDVILREVASLKLEVFACHPNCHLLERAIFICDALRALWSFYVFHDINLVI